MRISDWSSDVCSSDLAVGPACPTIVTQYGELAARAETLGERLDEIDNANGGSLNVTAVGDALRDALAKPVGKRPYRIFVDGQKTGVEAILAIKNARKAAILAGLGLSHLRSEASREGTEGGRRCRTRGTP